jgi:hypothetical protein
MNRDWTGWGFLSGSLLFLYLAFFYACLFVEYPIQIALGWGAWILWVLICMRFRGAFINRFEHLFYQLVGLDLLLEGFNPYHAGYGFWLCALGFWSVLVFYRWFQITANKNLEMFRFLLLLTAPLLGVLVTSCDAQEHEDDLSRLRPRPPEIVSAGELEQSIAAGVNYLIESQRADGRWGGPQWTGGVDADPIGSFQAFDVAVTAMCLEALLDVEQSEAIVTANEKAYRYLMSRTDNIKRGGPGDLPNIWAHCYCIQTLTKMLQRTRDESRKQELTAAINEHMLGLKRWQSIHGGWFYYDSGTSQPSNPSCSFVNAAVLIALARAKDAGFNADGEMVRKALRATQLMRKPDSSYLYTLRIPADKLTASAPINRPAGSLGRSQAGNLALRLWGDDRITEDVLHVWLDRLVSRHGWLDMGRKKPIPHESHAQVAGYFYYFGVYYGAMCIEQLPAAERPFYRHHLARIIIDRQEKDGSWFDYPLYSYHKPYGTAFALLALQQCR